MLGVLSLASTPAKAAYRSTVEAGPVRLEAPPQLRGTLDDLAERTKTILPELERSLGVEPRGPITVVLIPAGRIVDPEIARLDRAAPPWAAGFALNPQRLIGIRLARAETYPFGDASAVLAHEIAHVLVHDAVSGGSDGGGTVPRWFSEGVATREQRRWSVRDAVVYSSSLMVGGLPTLSEMDRAFLQSESSARRAYAASFDFLNWSSEEYGDDLVRRVLAAARTRPFPEAWQSVAGVPLAASQEAWRGTALTWYRWIPALTGAGTLWLAITLLFLFAAWRRRQKTLAMITEMEIEEERTRARWTPRPPDRHPEERTGSLIQGGSKDEEGRWVN